MKAFLPLFILILLFSAQSFSQNKKTVIKKKAAVIVKPKVITEAEAKQIHQQQQEASGIADKRSAYKRGDFETTVAAIPDEIQIEKKLPVAKPIEKTVVAKASPKPLKFIENIVLERNNR